MEISCCNCLYYRDDDVHCSKRYYIVDTSYAIKCVHYKCGLKHENCINLEFIEKFEFKDGKPVSKGLKNKCFQGHDLNETLPCQCEDYELMWRD